MLIMIVILILIVLFLLSNYTFVFHNHQQRDVFTEKYTSTEDLWFTHEKNTHLVIFLHGMYSTPQTFEDIAPILLKKGFDVYIPTLPASAQTQENLKEIGAWAWEGSMKIVHQKIENISKNYTHRFIGGHSQGGALALLFSTKYKFNGVLVLASPMKLGGHHLKWWQNLGIFFAGFLSSISHLPVLSKVDTRIERFNVEKVCDVEGIIYPWTIFTFKKGLFKLRRSLHKINIPIFISYCHFDSMVNIENKEFLLKKLKSAPKIVDYSFSVPRDVEPYGHRHQILNYKPIKKDLEQAIVQFLEDCLKNF